MKKILFSIILLCGLLASGFWFFKPPAEPKPQEPLKIGIIVWPGYAHAFLAQKKGFFERENLNIELILTSELSEIIQLYKKGKLDGFFGVFTDIIMLNADGFFTQVVYVADYSDTGDLIIGKPNFKSLQDLKGKTIAFEGVGTFSQMLVLSLLEKAGIQPGEFQAVNLPVHEVLTALEANEIDAGHTWEPTSSQALKKGYKILGKAGDIPGLITDVLAFRDQAIKNRPNDIRKMVKGLLQARDFLYQHPKESIKIMARANNMSIAEMETGINGIYYPDLSENVAAMQPSGALWKSGQKSVAFYLQSGQLFEKPNFDTLIYAQFVQDLQ